MSAILSLDVFPKPGEILSTFKDGHENPPVNVPEQKGVLALVTSVVDGDTIHVEINGSKYGVRLIGIDSPETVHPQKEVECFGKEASQKLKEILEQQTIYLHADISQGDKDKYGRLLGYVFLQDGTHVNLRMIQEGYAYEYTYDEPYLYQNSFKKAENDARNTKSGLWAPGACEQL